MTAPQPATPGSDSVRAQITEALRADILNVTAPHWAERVADELVPLVDRLRAEAKAEALETFADELDAAAVRCAEWPEVAETYRQSAGAARYFVNRDRAAAIRESTP